MSRSPLSLYGKAIHLTKNERKEMAMNQRISNLTMVERQELVREIDDAHHRGIRLNPKLVAEARDSLVLRKPKPEQPKADEPTQAQINRMLRHFGKL